MSRSSPICSGRTETAARRRRNGWEEIPFGLLDFSTQPSRPGIVPFRQTPTRASRFTAVGLCQGDEGIEERFKAGIRLVEPEPAELVEHALVREEIVTRSRQPLQVEQAGVIGGKVQQVIGKLLERGRGAKIPLIAVIFLRLAPAPGSRRPAELRQRELEPGRSRFHATCRSR